MKIEWLLWDDWNREHISRHQVDTEEVEELIVQPFEMRKTRKGYYALRGRSYAGRYLVVIVDDVGDGRTYVVTAREMTESEKRQFRRSL